MLIVVNYHYVRPVFDAPYPGIHGITPEQLEAQLRLLRTTGEFVSGEQVRGAVRGTGSLPARAILVTFDDGLREQFEHALPVLKRLGVPGVFFVNTHSIAHGTVSTVHKIHLLRAHTPPRRLSEMLLRTAQARGATVTLDTADDAATIQYPYDTLADARLKYALNFQLPYEMRDALIDACFRAAFNCDEATISARLYMNTAQLQELGAQGWIGTHGHEHVPLGRQSRATVALSVRTSLDLLAAWAGYRPYALSYPYGSYLACTQEAGSGASDAGIEFAFTMERAGNVDLAIPLYLARFDCNDVPGGSRAWIPIHKFFERVARAQWHRSVEEICEPETAGLTGHQ
jgi:peptidoglycan/xylan/chitin deacetylase (PgdA/CDA1 family)